MAAYAHVKNSNVKEVLIFLSMSNIHVNIMHFYETVQNKRSVRSTTNDKTHSQNNPFYFHNVSDFQKGYSATKTKSVTDWSQNQNLYWIVKDYSHPEAQLAIIYEGAFSLEHGQQHLDIILDVIFFKSTFICCHCS